MESAGYWKSEVGDFQFIKKLGEGGFGEVWLASDPRRGEQVAVKFLHLKHSEQSDIDLFKREFEILAELKQVHLARVFDFGFSSENEQYFLSTEFCPGTKLMEAIEGKPVVYFEEILVQILTALECIHSQGVIHFDIKPENVLVEDVDGRPNAKLVDFGVAVRLKSLPERIGGTLAFTAPEVLQHSPKLDHRVDLYSLGMLCLLCLTKRLPFAAFDMKDVLDWHRSGTLSPSLWKGRDVPAYLREITEKLIAKNPSERFSNSRVVLNFLNLATGGKYRQEEEELNAQIPIEGPIVERREEFLLPILDRLQSVLHPGEAAAISSVYTIHGETGIGKSRILEEVRHAIQLKDISFLQIDCEWNTPAWPKLEKWLGIPQFSSDALEKNWQIRRRMDAMLEAAKKTPFCLLIDDFHKAEPDMKGLIAELEAHTQNLRQAGEAVPLFILVASEEESESGIKLRHLTPAGISHYLKLVLGEMTPTENLAELLYQYSGGLPLLMVEGLRYIAPHFFRGESLENLLRPDKIHLLYEDKIKKLQPGEEELLLILALLFRPASEQELLKILRIGSGDLVDLATPCFKSGLLTGNLFGDPVYRASSQALALDLIGCLDAQKRRGLHLKIARGLVEVSGIAFQELAYHFGKAGETIKAIAYFQRAGTGLEREGKISSATDCLKKALELMPPGSDDWQRLSLKAFRLLVLSGDYHEAQKYPQQLEPYPSRERDEIEGWYYFKTRQFLRARAKYAEVLRALPETESLQAIKVENALGNIDLQEGKFEEAVSRFSKSFEREKELSDEERNSIQDNNLGISLSLLGKHDEALAFFRQRLDQLAAQKNTEKLSLINRMGFSCLQASRYEDAISTLNQAMTLAEDSGAFHALFSIMGNLMTALLKLNRFVEALSISKKIVSYQKRFGNRRDISHNLLRQGSVYLMLGMGEFAHECFHEGHKTAEEISDLALAGWFLLIKGYWEREFGEVKKAEDFCRQAQEQAGKASNEELSAWARYALADIAHEQNKVAKCRDHLAEILFQTQDQEFDTRLQLLRAKIESGPGQLSQFAALEAKCLKNNFWELLWEVYQAWGQACLKRNPEEAIQFFEKGTLVIQRISASLPEEYQTRFLHQRARRKLFEDLEDARKTLNGGFFQRLKKIF